MKRQGLGCAMIRSHAVLNRFAAAGLLLAGLSMAGSAAADGIVAKVVNSPLNAAGLVKGGYAALNIYLQRPDARGIDFFNPHVPGYGIPAGGRIEVELGGGFKRNTDVKLGLSSVHMVSGTPQHGLSPKKYGYLARPGANDNIYIVTAASKDGIAASRLLPRASVAKLDPVMNSGLKVFHMGLGAVAFTNQGEKGSVSVRIIDGDGRLLGSGTAEVDFWDAPRAQIHPNNFLHKGHNHNWQRIRPGQTLGKTAGTVPMTFMLFDKAVGTAAQINDFKKGIAGAGVMSAKQLAGMGYKIPKALARYDAGLIVRDKDGDGKLDAAKDQIIGGVKSGPSGAGAFEVRSLVQGGAPLLSQLVSDLSPKRGKRFGGAIMQVQLQAGTQKGTLRPTFALLNDPDNLASGDGTFYTYTVIVE
jgi:hypothetical protein